MYDLWPTGHHNPFLCLMPSRCHFLGKPEWMVRGPPGLRFELPHGGGEDLRHCKGQWQLPLLQNCQLATAHGQILHKSAKTFSQRRTQFDGLFGRNQKQIEHRETGLFVGGSPTKIQSLESTFQDPESLALAHSSFAWTDPGQKRWWINRREQLNRNLPSGWNEGPNTDSQTKLAALFLMPSGQATHTRPMGLQLPLT